MQTPCCETNSTYPRATLTTAPEFNSVCLCVNDSAQRHLLYSKVWYARIVFVALGRASSHRSVMTGSYSVSHRQCSSSFWISPLVAVAAGVLTGIGWCWRPVVTNSRPVWNIHAIWWNSWQLLQQYILWEGKTNLIKSGTLDGVWMCTGWTCVCVSLEIGCWPIWALTIDCRK